MEDRTKAAGIIIKWLTIAAAVILVIQLALERPELVAYVLIIAVLLFSSDRINKGSKMAWWFLVLFLVLAILGIAILLLTPVQKYPRDLISMGALLIISVPLLVILMLDPPNKWKTISPKK